MEIIPPWILIQSGNYTPLEFKLKVGIISPWIQIESGNYLPLNSNSKWELYPPEFLFKVGIIPPWIQNLKMELSPLNSNFPVGLWYIDFLSVCILWVRENYEVRRRHLTQAILFVFNKSSKIKMFYVLYCAKLRWFMFCGLSSIYRVTHKGWYLRGDCTELSNPFFCVQGSL